MRRYFVAVLTALTVVIGLATVSVGTASADTPCQVAQAAESAAHTAYNSATTDADKATKLSVWRDAQRRVQQECNRGGGNGGGIGNGHNNGPWSDRIDGRYFRLDRGPALDICDSGASSYDLWLNRNGSYRDRIVRQLNAQRWNDLRRSDCGAAVVSSDGNCVTFVDQNRNYGNLYNRDYPTWNNLNTRNLRRENLSTSDRRNLERLARDLNNYRNQWNTTRDSLRTICNDPTPPVTIINQAAAIPAPVIVNQAPAATAPSGVSSGSIPSGSVNTGGWSVGFVLAHNRAI